MNRTFAIALILLALLVISIGIAVAGGLVRIHRDDANPFSLAGPLGHCDQTLPKGVLLTVLDTSDQTQLTTYDDGLSVTGYPTGSGATVESGLEGSWSKRHLTSEGLSLLISAITGSSLPSCQTFNYSGGYEIRARTGADVYSIRLGPDVLETRVTTPSQAAAVDELVARLKDPDLGLPAGSWDEDQWHDYVPARWRFSLQFYGPSEREYPASDAILLPDGSTLRTFGIEEPLGSLDPSSSPQGLSMQRCAVTGPEEARAIGAILTEAGGSPEGSSGWHFTDGEPVGDLGGSPLHNIVSVTVLGLLSQEPDCESEAGPAATPTPAPAPSMPADEPAPLADSCDYLPAALITDSLGPIEGATEHYPGWSTDWAFCWQPVAGNGLVIFASRRPIPGDRAAAQAESLFGEVGFSADQIAGHDVFFNGCESNDGQCRAAVAISAPPHFVVISWEPGSQATLRQLAEGLITELDGSAQTPQ